MTSIQDALTEPVEPKPIATPAGKKDRGTDYIVLRQDGANTNLWVEVNADGQPVFAANAGEAIVTGSSDTEGTYVAIPVRSWKPARIAVETTTRVRLEDA